MNKFLYRLLYYTARLLSFLPFRLLFILADIVYFIAYYCVGYRRKVVQKNLRNSFPEKNDYELKEIERQFYHNLCDYFFETIKLMDMSRKQMLEHIQYENIDIVENALNSGRNVVLYLSHTFNWEWLVSMKLALSNVDKNVVVGQIYHPLENDFFDQLFIEIRSVFGQKNIAMKETLRELVKCKKDKTPFLVGFIADQVPVWQSVGGFVDFMHQDTPVFTGTERIAYKFDAVVCYGDIIKEERGRYRFVLSLLTDDCKKIDKFEITRRYMKNLEAFINEHPSSWLWSHRRWKRTRKDFIDSLNQRGLKKTIKENGVVC